MVIFTLWVGDSFLIYGHTNMIPIRLDSISFYQELLTLFFLTNRTHVCRDETSFSRCSTPGVTALHPSSSLAKTGTSSRPLVYLYLPLITLQPTCACRLFLWLARVAKYLLEISTRSYRKSKIYRAESHDSASILGIFPL